MRGLILISLAAAISALQGPLEVDAAQQSHHPETENVLPDMDLVLLQDIRLKVEATLQKHQEEFDSKFNDMKIICTESMNTKPDFELLPEEWESKMEQLVGKFVDQLLRFSEGAVKAVEKQMVETLDSTLNQVDLKLTNVKGEITNLKTQISELATQDEVSGLQNNLTDLATNTIEAIKSKLSDLTTSQDVNSHNQQIEEHLQNISKQVGNMTKCSNSEAEKQVLSILEESDKRLAEFSEILQDNGLTSQQCSSSCNGITEQLEGLKETILGNMKAMSGLNESLENMQDSFATRVEGLENSVHVINELIQSKTETAPAVTTPITTTSSTPVSIPFNVANPPPCLDSNFLGAGRSLNVCNAAVRFRKCHLTFVAIHCCRSCRDAGLISSVPVFNGSRDVPVLQALKSIRPV